MRVRVVKTPMDIPEYLEPMTFEAGGTYAGQNSYGGLNLGDRRIPNETLQQKNPYAVNQTLKEVPDHEATLEAESGETLLRTMPDGSPAHFNIDGKPHSEGGTKLAGEPGDFIFSQTKAMKMGGSILEHFGKSKDTKKKYTPADLSKQYKINEYVAILNDPNSDKLQKKTVQMNIDNGMGKLQDLAFVQEMKKGFPQGLPEIGASKEGTVTGKYGGRFQSGGSYLSGSSAYASNYLAPDVYRPDITYPNIHQPSKPVYFIPNQQNSLVFTNPGEGVPYSSDFARPYGETPTGENPNWNATPWDPNYPPANDDNYVINSFMNPASWNPKVEEPPLVNQPGFPESFEKTTNPYKFIPPKDTSLAKPGVAEPENIPYKNYGSSRGDKTAQLAATYALANTGQYTPYIAPIPQPELVHPTYMSPEREIAAIQESANAQNMINAMTQPGARQRSIGSNIQGQTIPAIGNVLARTQAGDVDISNRIAEKNADTLNKYNFEKANRLTNLHGLSTQLDSTYRDAINQRLGNLAKVNQEVESNIYHLNATNAMNPNFEYDPRTRNIRFKPGYRDLNSAGSEQQDPGKQLAYYKAIFKAGDPSMSDEEARKMAFSFMKAQKEKITTSPYNTKKNTYQQSGTRGYSDPNTYDYDV